MSGVRTRVAAVALATAIWGPVGIAAARTPQPAGVAAQELARLVVTAARQDTHMTGVAIDRSRRRGVQSLTAWYAAKPGSYADSGAYRLRVVTSGHTLLSVSAASFGQAHSYVAGQTPENEAGFLIRFVRIAVRGHAQWELREHDKSDSCGYHTAAAPPSQHCVVIGGTKESLQPNQAEASEFEHRADELIASARRHAPA